LIGLWLNSAELTGDVIVICGGLTYAMVVAAEAELPATSTACTLTAFVPAARDCVQVNEEPVTVAATPLQVTFVNPDNASLTAPLILTVDVFTIAP
jgi:hypothetical protein